MAKGIVLKEKNKRTNRKHKELILNLPHQMHSVHIILTYLDKLRENR